MEPVTTAAVVAIAGGVLSGTFTAFVGWLRARIRPQDEVARAEQTLDSRLADLGRTMSEASQLMVLVETEIKARQEQISRLADELKQQEQLAALTKEAKDAVAAVFRAEIAREGRKTKWQSFWMGFVFFLLGSVVTFLVTYYVQPGWG